MYNKEKDLKKFLISQGVNTGIFDDYQKYNIRNGYIEPTVIEERNMTSMTSISVYSRLLIDRQIFLGTEINSDVANIVTAQLLWLEQQGNSDVQLLINSPGGSVSDGLQIIDCMNLIKPDVSTTVVGTSASMAAVISSSGTKGKRYILPHAKFMIHQVLGNASGQCADIQIQAEHMKSLQKELYAILSDNSGISYDEIEKLADRDRWFTSQETVEYHFADEIIKKK